MISRELEDVLVSCLFFDENNLGICLYFGSEYNDIIQAKQDIKNLLKLLDNVEKVREYCEKQLKIFEPDYYSDMSYCDNLDGCKSTCKDILNILEGKENDL